MKFRDRHRCREFPLGVVGGTIMTGIQIKARQSQLLRKSVPKYYFICSFTAAFVAIPVLSLLLCTPARTECRQRPPWEQGLFKDWTPGWEHKTQGAEMNQQLKLGSLKAGPIHLLHALRLAPQGFGCSS